MTSARKQIRTYDVHVKQPSLLINQFVKENTNRLIISLAELLKITSLIRQLSCIYIILISRSTYIILCNCLYKLVTGGHFGPSSSGGLGALPLGAFFGFQI